LEPFALDYTVSASLWTEEYGLNLICQNRQLKLQPRNAPGIRRTNLETGPIQEIPAIDLPAEEAIPILDSLRQVRIALQAIPRMDVTDSSFYRLNIRFGDLDLALRWYDQIPANWSTLQPLQDIIENYAARYSHANCQSTTNSNQF
jgi:hypothetical protein